VKSACREARGVGAGRRGAVPSERDGPPVATRPAGWFHVTTRGVFRTLVHRDRVDYVTFLRLLDDTVRRHDWQVDALCLMPTHHHLLVRCRRLALSRGMHDLNGSYAKAFNHRHGRHGHVFGDRFVSRAIRDERHYRTACRYVAANPVRAGLCRDAAEWPWARNRFDGR
jgi:putative transposase